jgi:hypothetical protein
MVEFEKRLACVINADGTIVRGYKIDNCTFDGIWQVPLQHDAKTNFAATIGSAFEEPVPPGLITVGLSEDPAEMQVHTYDPSGKPAARSFHIACFRD